MAEIQFENEQEFAQPEAYENAPRGIPALVVKWGLAKDEQTARYVLLGVAIVAGVLAFLVPTFFGTANTSVPQAQIDAAMQRPH